MGGHTIFGLVVIFLLGIAQLALCERCIESEKQALLKFKASIHDDPYKSLFSWNPKTNCCQWHGIACHNVTGHVLKLDLSDYVLQAAGVDPSLLELQHLIYLDLSENNFNGGSIPVFLGSMERLRYLSISASNFTGKIPANLGENLTDLQFLDLSWNDLLINDMNWVSKLQSLRYLNLSFVYLGEAYNLFQVLHMLPSLSELQLEQCGLHNLSTLLSPINFTSNTRVQLLNLAMNEIDGRILPAFQNWTSIQFLDLSDNKLRALPLWLGTFNNLLELYVRYNLLDHILDSLQNSTSIKVLDLSGNHVSPVPSWLGRLKNLVSLDIAANALFGSIPIVLRNLTSLEYLSLRANNFSSIPAWIGELQSLRYLDMSTNQMTPIMESSVSQILESMCHLKILHFDNNNLQGEAFGDFNLSRCIKYDIEELHLSNNKLNGHLPTWLGHLENLNTLDLSNNYFCGNIPQSLGQLEKLSYLYLSNNYFNGSIPQNFDQLERLAFLDLSNNSFSGNIPQSFGQLVNLLVLDLSNNFFSGHIPQGLCNLVILKRLDLPYNNFSGEIPNCWRDNHPIGLLEINLSFNKLSGAFPISFGELSSLLWLHLNNNYLEGKLPLTLKNSMQLRILDLGENKFSGSIPSWTHNTFPTLQILRLRDNMLDGNIPLNVCLLRSLQILDLANNNLSGAIPHCIGNLTGMTKDSVNMGKSTNQTSVHAPDIEWSVEGVKQVMKGREFDFVRILPLVVNLDFSNNNLVGSIPPELFSLIGLIGLNLSHNHLKGGVPETIGDMKSLESFDISCNQISSTIPKSMTKLTALSYLNMSYNNLSGLIPTENQFLTLNDPSIYAGNPYLCGIPLPLKCQGDGPHQVPQTREFEDENDPEKVWFYFVIAIGFAVGFWGIIGTLVLKKSWRYACFRRVEDVADEIYVYTSIKTAKLKRLLKNHIHG